MANKLKIGIAGGCEEIISALQCHIELPDVVEGALRAVVNLAIINANRVRFLSCGGCEAVLKATMKEYNVGGIWQGWECFTKMHGIRCWGNGCDHVNSRIAEQGCKALYNLTFNASARNRLVSCDAKKLIQEVKDKFPSTPNQTWAKYALRRLNRGLEIGRERIGYEEKRDTRINFSPNFKHRVNVRKSQMSTSNNVNLSSAYSEENGCFALCLVCVQ